jgi:hypothetical protein
MVPNTCFKAHIPAVLEQLVQLKIDQYRLNSQDPLVLHPFANI